MDDKIVKKMIYMTIILFLFVFVSFIFAKKSTSDLKREQEQEQQQIAEQESRYNKQFKDNEINQTSSINEQNRDASQYNDENTINNKHQSDVNDIELPSENNTTINQPPEQKTVEITKLTDKYIQDGYSIVKDFEINSTKFAIISKKSEFQSEYSKSVKKKYYIYKYIGQKLYETAYIMDVSVPKDKEDNESDVFAVNVKNNTVEIKVNILSDTIRQYNKQQLLATPISGVNILETITESK